MFVFTLPKFHKLNLEIGIPSQKLECLFTEKKIVNLMNLLTRNMLCPYAEKLLKHTFILLSVNTSI